MVVFYILIAWFIIEILLRKLLNVKHKGLFGRYEHFNQKHALIERYILVIFLLIITIEIFIGFLHNSASLVWLYLMALLFSRGIQEWKFDRENREYVFNWFGSAASLIIFFLFLLEII